MLKYTDFLKETETFLSLDISVHSTGWVLWVNNNLSYGTYALASEDELGRRVEFRQFLVDLLKDKSVKTVYVEDVIAGVNFKTAKGLIQLNSIIDDLKMFGLVSVSTIKRVNNKTWKKYLKKAASYTLPVKLGEDKKMIRECVNFFGFKEEVEQDIYDALGMVIGCIYNDLNYWTQLSYSDYK